MILISTPNVLRPIIMAYLLGYVMMMMSASTTTAYQGPKPVRPSQPLVRSTTTTTTKKSTVSTTTPLKPWPKPVVECQGDYRDEAFLEQHIGGPLYANQANLPRLPVPTLEETVARFLPTALPLAESPEEEEHLQEACKVFVDKEARPLQERLIQRRDEMKDSSWLQQWWNKLGYLQVRDPNVIYVSYFFQLEDDVTILDNEDENLAIKRGAAALVAAADFRKLVCSGEFPCETIGKQQTPLCSAAYKYMFHACRIPKLQEDTYKIYDPSRNNHAIVACRGHFYKVALVDDVTGETLPLQVLEEQLKLCEDMARQKQQQQSLMEEENDDIPFELGWLTTSNRDEWAKARNELLRRGGSKMEQALTTLESGALLLCLDDEVEPIYEQCALEDDVEPISYQQCAQHYWYGSGGNRWFDKSIQLVCTNNGKLGYIGEHSMMDGMPVTNLCNHILKTTYQDCVSSAPATTTAAESSPEGVKDIFEDVWTDMSQVDKDHIQDLIMNAELDFTKLVNEHEVNVQSFQGYGSNFIKTAGFSPDAYVQMAIQLASYRLFRKQVATYEATQVRPFLHGRTETTRAASDASQAFVERMGLRPQKDKYKNPEARQEKLSLLREAAQSHREYIGNAAQGKGVDRHMFGLSMLVQENESAPSLFSDPLYLRSKRWRVSSSTVAHSLGFGEVVPDGVGIGYEVKPNSCIFTVTGRREHHYTEPLCFLLEEALLEMRDLIDLDTPPMSKL